MSNVHAKEKISYRFETELLSKTFRNPKIEKDSGEHKKINILEKWMDRMKGEDFKEENQRDICTNNCALMHSFLCILIKVVMLKTQKHPRKKVPFRI